MAHALYSPSAAERWFGCPASAKMNAQAEFTSSLPAATGTLIHHMTEMLLKDRLRDMTLRDYWLGRKEIIEDFEIEIDEDMVECAEVYVDYILKRQEELNARRLIEEKIYLSAYSDKLYGTADCILLSENRICLIDLKSGKMIVDPFKNKQLMIYALGALDRYGGGNENIIVELTIVQPKDKRNPVKTHTISAPNLAHWGDTDLSNALAACDEENPRFVYDKNHCRFCNYRTNCDEFKKNTEEK